MHKPPAKLNKSPEFKVGLTEELHKRLHVQARNLLFEYRNSITDEDLRLKRGYVPCEIVEKLMRLYGDLIAREIWQKMQKAQPHPLDVLKQLFGSDLDAETESKLRAICDAPATPPKQDSSC